MPMQPGGPCIKSMEIRLPDWKTYLASPCMSSAGHVGGAVSVGSFLSLNVSSNPNPLGPFGPDGTLCRRNHSLGHQYHSSINNYEQLFLQELLFSHIDIFTVVLLWTILQDAFSQFDTRGHRKSTNVCPFILPLQLHINMYKTEYKKNLVIAIISDRQPLWSNGDSSNSQKIKPSLK